MTVVAVIAGYCPIADRKSGAFGERSVLLGLGIFFRIQSSEFNSRPYKPEAATVKRHASPTVPVDESLLLSNLRCQAQLVQATYLVQRQIGGAPRISRL